MEQIETNRIRIIPLSLENLELYLDQYEQMESNLGLNITGIKPGERQKAVIKLRLDKVKEDPCKYLWNTIWLIALCEENRKIGSIMIKGCPNDDGEVTVGYSIDEKYRCNGYMTEALNSLIGWIFSDLNVKRIIADTIKNNIPSQRVLQKVGMIRYKEDDECFWWKLERQTEKIKA